jgi:hypothetical protein
MIKRVETKKTTAESVMDLYKETKDHSFTDMLYPYQQQAIKDIIETPSSLGITSTSRSYQTLSNVNNTDDMIRLFGNPVSYDYYHAAPTLRKQHDEIDIEMKDGSYETVTRDELIKYISERKLIKENHAVRSMYERYQVAVKLVRSDDNGDTGV